MSKGEWIAVISGLLCCVLILGVATYAMLSARENNGSATDTDAVTSSISEGTDLADGLSEGNTPSHIDETSFHSELPQHIEAKIKGLGCKSLVVVSSNGTNAQIKLYQHNSQTWIENKKMECSGFVGQRGVVTEMSEGNAGTPAGLYSITEAFYISEKPVTGLDVFQVTEDTYWVDDPDSKFYNKRVEGTQNKDWNSAEHMIDYTRSYDLGFVINYNPEGIYNAGSAIFFHVGDNPTLGCIATTRDMVKSYLEHLSKQDNPYIYIE